MSETPDLYIYRQATPVADQIAEMAEHCGSISFSMTPSPQYCHDLLRLQSIDGGTSKHSLSELCNPEKAPDNAVEGGTSWSSHTPSNPPNFAPIRWQSKKTRDWPIVCSLVGYI